MIDKIKTLFNKNISLSFKYNSIFLVIIMICLAIVYHIGTIHKLNTLIAEKAQTTSETLKQASINIADEINSLSDKKNELSATLSNKNEMQSAMSEYSSNKTNYTTQISQLNTDIANLDSSIQKKQTELDTKIAEKKEQERVEAERAAIAAQAAREANMVWVGDSGSKYHYKNCRTLKGNKYQITLEEAEAQGRTACKVCH